MEDINEVYRCSSCGARLISNSIVNVKCAYCGSIHFVKEKIKSNYVPDTMILFENDINSVTKVLKFYINSSDYIDSKIKSSYRVLSVIPVYVPCTIYNYGADVFCNYTYISSSGDSSTTYYREKKEKLFYEMLQDCSVNVADDFVNSLEPFDFSRMRSFNPVYLSGAYVELADDIKAYDKTIHKIKKNITNRNDYGNNVFLECGIHTIDKINVYLPIWFAKIKANNTIYSFVMNDGSGKWVTNAKMSTLKQRIPDIFLMVTLIISLIVCLIILNGLARVISIIFIFVLIGTLFKAILDHENILAIKNHLNRVEKSTTSPDKTIKQYDNDISEKDAFKGKEIRFTVDGKQLDILKG